jgi:hypothetical protein
MLELPESYEALEDEDEDEKTQVQSQVEKSFLSNKYETDTKITNPILHDILHMEHLQTRQLSVSFADNTWDDDIMSFRQCLIRVAQYVSPIPITQSINRL